MKKTPTGAEKLRIEQQQLRNIETVKGTRVRVRKDKESDWSTKTARIVNYHPPLLWELNRSIYGTKYYHTLHIQTLDGGHPNDLVPDPN